MTNYLPPPFQLSRNTSFLSWGGESNGSIDFFISKYFLRTHLVSLRPVVNILIKKIKTSSEGKCLLISWWWCFLGDVCLFIAAGICARYPGSSYVPPTVGGQLGSCAALRAVKWSLKCSPVSGSFRLWAMSVYGLQCWHACVQLRRCGVAFSFLLLWCLRVFAGFAAHPKICQMAHMEVVMRLMGGHQEKY